MTQWLSHRWEIEPNVSFCEESHYFPVRATTLECAFKGEEPAPSKVKTHLLGRNWASKTIKVFLVFFPQELFGLCIAEQSILHTFLLLVELHILSCQMLDPHDVLKKPQSPVGTQLYPGLPWSLGHFNFSSFHIKMNIAGLNTAALGVI